jgi:hypothetical protein
MTKDKETREQNDLDRTASLLMALLLGNLQNQHEINPSSKLKK